MGCGIHIIASAEDDRKICVYGAPAGSDLDACVSTAKPCIVHMVEGFDQVGGPAKLVRLIIDSSLREKYQFYVLSYSIVGFNLGAILRLYRRLVSLAPDIVHLHGLKSDAFHAAVAARLARARRLLVAIHGSAEDPIPAYWRAPMRLRRWVVAQVLEPVTLRLAHAVYCVCNAMKERPRIRRNAGSRLRDTIYNGIPREPPRSSGAARRGAFGFAQDDVVLIYTGRIHWSKGLEILAAALQQVARWPGASDNLKLLLVGDGPDFERVRVSFQPLIQSRRVVMTGSRVDIDALNLMADVFVFPSLSENLPFSLLEAMDAGLPVIATAVGGIPEVIVDGQTGLLVPPCDVTALAQAILRLASDRPMRERLGHAGRLEACRRILRGRNLSQDRNPL